MVCPKCGGAVLESLSRKHCTNKDCNWEYVFAFHDPDPKVDDPYMEYDGKGNPLGRYGWNGKY